MTNEILIVDDEDRIRRLLKLYLERESFEIHEARDGKEAYELALENNYACILLDLMLPEMDGIEVASKLREHKDTPIIMLTAKGEETNRVEGFESGADDYIVKPFAIEELLARVRAIFRRQEIETKTKEKGDSGSFRDLSLNTHNRSAMRGDEEISLTKREFDLLNVLMTNMNRVMTREELLEHVWKYDVAAETNVVDVYIRYLRGKIDIPGRESYIQTVRGMGYVIREK